MEFRFDIGKLLPNEIVAVDSSLVIKGWQSTTRNRVEYQQLYDVINIIGEASSFAQGLSKVITTAEKLQNSDHILYLMKEEEPENGRSVLVGMLKIGRKKLFLLDHNEVTKETAPLCVLDFYVHESRQRRGYGRHLFDYMLRDQKVEPGHMAVDKPSDKFMGFLKKHYKLVNQVPQVNNFVIYEDFFNERPVGVEESAMTHVVRSNRSSRTASPDRSPSPGNSRRASATSVAAAAGQGYAGKPSTRHKESSIPLHSSFREIDAHNIYLDQYYTSDILHGRPDCHQVGRLGHKHQTTLDWMRGSSAGAESPFSRTPKSYSPSRTPSHTGSPLARTPRGGSPHRSQTASPPKPYSAVGSRKHSAELLDDNDCKPNGSIAPTPATSPERKVEKKVEILNGRNQNGHVDDTDSLCDKAEEMTLQEAVPQGKTGGWRDSVSRSSEGLVEHMSTVKGTTMTGVLQDNESVHGHLKFHHHALW